MGMGELVIRAKNKDKAAMEEIINKLTPLIIKMSCSTFIRGYEIEDLKQIGYISIINAVNKFDANKNDNFIAYAMMAVRNNYFYEIRKKVKENTDISFDYTMENGVELSEVLADSFNIEEGFTHNEDLERLAIALQALNSEESELINFIYNNGSGALKRYAEIKKINYQTCAKRKVAILKKLKVLLSGSS